MDLTAEVQIVVVPAIKKRALIRYRRSDCNGKGWANRDCYGVADGKSGLPGGVLARSPFATRTAGCCTGAGDDGNNHYQAPAKRHDGLQEESDRLVRASRIFGRALSLCEGDRDAAKHWLSEPQKALGGTVPLILARTEVGALEVERLIGRLEHGVFT